MEGKRIDETITATGRLAAWHMSFAQVIIPCVPGRGYGELGYLCDQCTCKQSFTGSSHSVWCIPIGAACSVVYGVSIRRSTACWRSTLARACGRCWLGRHVMPSEVIWPVGV